MAKTALAKTSSAPAQRRGAVVSKAKFDALRTRINSSGKRAVEKAKERESDILSVGTGLVVGMMQAKNKSLPSVAGIDPNVLWGGLLMLFGPEVMKGRNGQRLGAIGTGMLTAGAYDSGKRGSVKVAGNDGEDNDEPPTG